jgi:hypothetical protein
VLYLFRTDSSRHAVRGLRGWPTSRTGFALGKLNNVAVRPPWHNEGVAHGGTVECPKQIVQGRWVCGRGQDEGCEHPDLGGSCVAGLVDGIAEFVNALV